MSINSWWKYSCELVLSSNPLLTVSLSLEYHDSHSGLFNLYPILLPGSSLLAELEPDLMACSDT